MFDEPTIFTSPDAGQPRWPTITGITPMPQDDNRVAIHVDGKRKVILPVHLVSDLELAVGTRWDRAIVTRVREAREFAKAYREASKRLARRAMSRAELTQKLSGLGHGVQVIARILNRLTELGLLGDEALGRDLIQEVMSKSPAGPRLIRAKLKAKHLSDDMIDQLVDEAADDPEHQLRLALDLAKTRNRSMKNLDADTRKRRLWGLLQRRGFDPEIAENAVRRVVEDTEPSDDTAFE